MPKASTRIAACTGLGLGALALLLALSEIRDSLCSLFLVGSVPKGFYILYVDAPFPKLYSPSLFEFPEGPRHRNPVRPDHRAQPLVGVVRWYLVALARPDTFALD